MWPLILLGVAFVAVIAAVELKESMKRMSLVFTEVLQGDREFVLNIGLAEGRDYFGCISDKPLKEYLVMGKATTEAARLSDLGNNGSIWSTKSLITRLNKNDRMRVGYGIMSRQANAKQLLEKRFSLIEDLLDDDKERSLQFNDIRESIVTEILNIP